MGLAGDPRAGGRASSARGAPPGGRPLARRRPLVAAAGREGGNVEVVDWGPVGPNEMVTLNALRVLHAAK